MSRNRGSLYRSRQLFLSVLVPGNSYQASWTLFLLHWIGYDS